MDEGKKINLKKHVSPKVPRSYLWRIVAYCLIIGGLITFILYLKNQDTPKIKEKRNPGDVKEIKEFTIEKDSTR